MCWCCLQVRQFGRVRQGPPAGSGKGPVAADQGGGEAAGQLGSGADPAGRDGAGQCYVLEVSGPVLPHAVEGLSHLLALTQRDFTASYSVHDPSTALNVILDASPESSYQPPNPTSLSPIPPSLGIAAPTTTLASLDANATFMESATMRNDRGDRDLFSITLKNKASDLDPIPVAKDSCFVLCNHSDEMQDTAGDDEQRWKVAEHPVSVACPHRMISRSECPVYQSPQAGVQSKRTGDMLASLGAPYDSETEASGDSADSRGAGGMSPAASESRVVHESYLGKAAIRELRCQQSGFTWTF